MQDIRSYFAADASAQEAVGMQLGAVLAGRGVVFLQGDLGAGKTTLSRGVLRAYGHLGAVKSPTYTLVEPYELGAITAYHFDLYRVQDPEELDLLGIRDYCRADTLALIEWPDRGDGFLPAPDWVIAISNTEQGRTITVSAHTDYGRTVLRALPADIK